jgi:hypothetical protein
VKRRNQKSYHRHYTNPLRSVTFTPYGYAVPVVGPTDQLGKLSCTLRNIFSLLLVCLSRHAIILTFLVISETLMLILSKLGGVNNKIIRTSSVVVFYIPVGYNSSLGEIQTCTLPSSPPPPPQIKRLVVLIIVICDIYLTSFIKCFKLNARKTVSDFLQCDIYTATNIPAINLLEMNELRKLTTYADKQRLPENNNVHSVDMCLSVARLCVVHRAICLVFCFSYIKISRYLKFN